MQSETHKTPRIKSESYTYTTPHTAGTDLILRSRHVGDDLMRPIRIGQSLELRWIQFHGQGPDELIELRELGHPDDWRGDARLMQHPRQRDLHIGQTPLPGDLRDSLDDGKIVRLVVEL